MGNFYTNFTVVGVERAEVLAAVKELRRRAFLIEGHSGDTVVFDQECDEQHVADIEALGRELSKALSTPVIGALNHDDDHLLLWVFRDGEKERSYESWTDAPRFAWGLSQIRGGFLAYPLIVLVLGWPAVLFQTLRHRAFVSLLSLPKSAVGFGYDYLARGELPEGHVAEDIQKA